MEIIPEYYNNQIQPDGSEGTYLDELKFYFGENYYKIIEYFKDGLVWNTEEHDHDYHFEISYYHQKEDRSFITRLNLLECEISTILWNSMSVAIYVKKEVIHKILNQTKV